MLTVFTLLLLSVGSEAATSKTFNARYPQRPPDLLSDFRKNNISSTWAPGHPKDWTSKDSIKYTFSDGGPQTYTTGAIPVAALSPDERLLVTVNASNHVSVIATTTLMTVAQFTFTSNYAVAPSALRVFVDSRGQYDVLISVDYQEIRRIRLSYNGTQIGTSTTYPGGLLCDYGSPSVSHHSRRVLAAVRNLPHYNIYDLDDATVNISLSNQIDDYFDASFSSDDQYVATRSFSYSGIPGSTKLFNTTTGTLIRDFGDTSSEVISISPDGNLLATSHNSDALQIWDLRNATSEPLTLSLPSKLIRSFTTLVWNTDGSYLSAGAYGNLFIWKTSPTFQLVQHLQLSEDQHDVSQLLWVEVSRRLAYRTFGGLEMYDFDTNLKYRWGFSSLSHWIDGPNHHALTYLARNSEWIGGLDSDANVRIWDYPT
ncbi:WD40 repeat-like protein [Lophiostoma macrostomum CBS 122681]|uniref:WD40 repeat-like protein n=1 Tax=Lophiostoma macrostomum CBS 122681 TaxID=1314788 RepID=A0A6A6SHW4_9PLEO|nr:WD40 repeat-like protein [Lophiostoma macrostomum CBS 122681]